MTTEELEAGMKFKLKGDSLVIVAEDFLLPWEKRYCFVNLQDGQVYFQNKTKEQIVERLNSYEAVLQD